MLVNENIKMRHFHRTKFEIWKEEANGLSNSLFCSARWKTYSALINVSHVKQDLICSKLQRVHVRSRCTHIRAVSTKTNAPILRHRSICRPIKLPPYRKGILNFPNYGPLQNIIPLFQMKSPFPSQLNEMLTLIALTWCHVDTGFMH